MFNNAFDPVKPRRYLFSGVVVIVSFVHIGTTLGTGPTSITRRRGFRGVIMAAKPSMLASKTAALRPARRARLAPVEREQMILEAAVSYFADHGFHAQIRELANSIGVSSGLIFRYFGSKDALIERVYQEVFVSRWRPGWTDLLGDANRSIRDRLVAFYRSYLTVVDDRNWICIAMRASLEGNDITRRYIHQHVNGLLQRIALLLRGPNARGAPAAPSHAELEIVWHLHSSIIYYAIRKHIHKVPVSADRDAFVALIVDEFLRETRSPEPRAAPGRGHTGSG